MDDLDGMERMTESLQSSVTPKDLPVFYEPVSVKSSPYEREILTEDVKSERQL